MIITRKAIGLFLLTVSGILSAREIRTPLPLMRDISHVISKREKHEKDWSLAVDVWGAGYHRSTDSAYGPCHGRERMSLSQIIFGKSNFRLEEAFADAKVDGPAILTNPLVAISTISPRFEYIESGAIFGINLASQITFSDVPYEVGVRARLPYRNVEMKQSCGGEFGASDLIGESLSDLYRERSESIGANVVTNTVYAARLDLVSALNRVSLTSTGGNDPLTVYSNGNIRIADVSLAADGNNDEPSAALIYSEDSSLPFEQRWGTKKAQINGILNADGAAHSNNNRLRVASTHNYTLLQANKENQSKLFVVPTLLNAAPNENTLTDGAKTIQSAINTAIKSANTSITPFLQKHGFDFCDGHVKGIGDLDLEMYLARSWMCDDALRTELHFAVKAPTARELKDCKKLIRQAIGNNGHVELRLGKALQYVWSDLISFDVRASYSWALKHQEDIAAPFKGATIRNFGPCVKADVSWGYFDGSALVNFKANDFSGINLGYAIHQKSNNKIRCAGTKARDLLGNEKELDVNVAEKNTKITSHKLFTEFFVRMEQCTISAGWSQVFAGKNAMRDTTWYLSFGAAF